MLRIYPEVLSLSEMATLQDLTERVAFVDGRASASVELADFKHNEQLGPNDPAITSVATIVGTALRRHPRFRADQLPRHVHSLRLARYREGMYYRPHVDAALMSEGAAMYRADASFTLALDEPAAYGGGELVIGDRAIALPAGALVVYPTGAFHEVREVTRGVRRVIVGWIQSLVRDAAARETLADLSSALELVRSAGGPRAGIDLIVKAHANLMRRWAEP
ncbi:MAG: Fe2+-dependent dioxygenase [Kofleriaceae bacterium]|nr:Fe2+-dependent dioxygenase [Kofleriaceae bacterium]